MARAMARKIAVTPAVSPSFRRRDRHDAAHGDGPRNRTGTIPGNIILTARGVEVACGGKLPHLDILAYNGGVMRMPGSGMLCSRAGQAASLPRRRTAARTRPPTKLASGPGVGVSPTPISGWRPPGFWWWMSTVQRTHGLPTSLTGNGIWMLPQCR